MGSKTSTEYWHERFGEYPKADIEKLCCAMMSEYANEKTKQQREVIERLKEALDKSNKVLITYASNDGINRYYENQKILREAESLLKEIE